MKRLSKAILTIFLLIVLLVSTFDISFATDDGDPVGNCAMPKYEAVK